MIQVLVAEDSPTTRALLVTILESDPAITVVGTAVDGLEAIELCLRLRPDLITMDVEMPRLDGLSATRQIMRETPTPILVVTASLHQDAVARSFAAIEAGALGIVDKPVNPAHPGFREQAEYLIEMVKSMATVKVVRDRSAPQDARPSSAPVRLDSDPQVIAIAASTGGPPAISQLLKSVDSQCPVPILVVQHIATGFTQGFASWLQKATGKSVRIARSGEVTQPGTVYIAPDGHHLGITPLGRIHLSTADPVGGHRPSADWLFTSVARSGRTAIVVVLTGMGNDGVRGLAALRAAGARILAQDASTSVVFGMPRAAIESGCVNEVLPIGAIGARLNELLRRNDHGDTRAHR